MGQIIDGKAIAGSIISEVAEKVKKLKEKKIEPKLAVILVGEDAASQIYVRNKEKDCEAAGISAETFKLKADIEEKELILIIDDLNKNKKVHGILVQLPLPKKINEEKITNRIDPEKDVDGLHTINMGKLLKGEAPYFMPCTPSGCMELLLSTGVEIKGKQAVVVGRSNIVGKPMAIMLLSKHATVTICHSRTDNLEEVCKRADILVAAVGKPELIKGSWIKAGAVVIDVGMNRLESGLVGDVEFKTAKDIVSYITPVPGGVGPMTRAMLVKNTFIAAERS